MIEYYRSIVLGQFEAALGMLNQCADACPPQHWDGKIANDTFRQIAYHTLFYVDYYLAPNENAFTLRALHQCGGDERTNAVSTGLSREETLAYAGICRQKIIETLAGETIASLQGPSGFQRLAFTRGELHLYNIRHVQHHAGQLSAYLRRVEETLKLPPALPWIRTGWRRT